MKLELGVFDDILEPAEGAILDDWEVFGLRRTAGNEDLLLTVSITPG